MKALLVMDMPENCYNCGLCYGHSVCVAKRDYRGRDFGKVPREVPETGKPDWCPLKPHPELNADGTMFVERREE